MAFRVPTSLIREVQIGLRKEAGIPSYDPNDPSLLDLPSLEEAIAGFDPSPPYLRCNQCRGRLLRGLQSTICVYCGAQQRRELPPDPISFKSTFAYRWLLDSLDLDGSEAVGLATGASESTKGQNASKDVLVLSDLLDFEINWPAESEKIQSSIANNSSVQIKSSLNLAGVDLDNFFTEAKKDTVPNVSEEQLAPMKRIESTKNHAFQGQQSLSFFENAQSSDTAVRSVTTEGVVGDPVSGWEVEFQSAGSGTLPVDSKAFDPFLVSSTIDLSSPVEVAFSPDTDLKVKINSTDNDVKPKNELVPLASMSNNWPLDDLWHTSNTGASNKTEQFQINSKAHHDGEPKDNSNDLSSMSDNWIQDDLWKSSHTKASDTEKNNEDDDSFDAWQDFTSSGNAPDPSSSSWELNGSRTTASEQASEMNLVSLSSNLQRVELSSFSEPDLFVGASELRNGSTDVNTVQLMASVSDRVAVVEAATGGDAERAANDDKSSDVTSQLESTDSNVETLMTQMHDLSFMLDSNLSIPNKGDVFKSVL